MVEFLGIAVLVTGAWVLVSLGLQVARVRAYGRRVYFAPAAGQAWKGVVYALGSGMSPAAKESTRQNLPVYFTGVGYHIGVLASLILLILGIAGIALVPGGLLLQIVRIPALIGALCGVVLLIRRLGSRNLRGLSCPDDYLANLLTTAFAALAFAHTMSPTVEPVFLLEASLLFLYIPLGKIRHCAFFFLSRSHTGAVFGRRGTFPPIHHHGATHANHAIPAGTDGAQNGRGHA